jgi:hypothetical protein
MELTVVGYASHLFDPPVDYDEHQLLMKWGLQENVVLDRFDARLLFTETSEISALCSQNEETETSACCSDVMDEDVSDTQQRALLAQERFGDLPLDAAVHDEHFVLPPVRAGEQYSSTRTCLVLESVRFNPL